MNCPSCAAAMTPLALGARLGTEVQIDLCPICQVIWFDRLESVNLSPGSTLKLFRLIGERPQKSPAPLSMGLKCPRCEIRLLTTNDRQRNTTFRYWRCGRDHGRLITYFDFLREKDFIKPLSAQQLGELRANVQTINCSNCGAPIDLTRESACTHCGSPLSMIDLSHIERVAKELRTADETSKTVDPTLPARVAFESWRSTSSSSGYAPTIAGIRRHHSASSRPGSGFCRGSSASYPRRSCSAFLVIRHCVPIFRPLRSPASRLATTSLSDMPSACAASAGERRSGKAPGSTPAAGGID